MDIKNNKEKEDEKKEGIKTNGNKELQRITVSKEGQAALESIKDRVNDGFSGGRVNLTQMANWIFLNFQNEPDEAQIKEIRAEHFDEVAMKHFQHSHIHVFPNEQSL